MKISLAWIGEFVEIEDLEASRVAELLSLHTAEVEGLEEFGSELEGVVVGEVVECGPHPEADRLSVTRVAFGGRETVPVVCGAPNVARGQKIAFAPAGTVLPGGLKLKKAKLRGQESHGMICSERELGLSQEHQGILVLPAEAPVGTALVEYLGLRDRVLELDNKSLTHRPDLWSHYGFARELAALLERPLRPLELPGDGDLPGEAPPVEVDPGEQEAGCPFYAALPVDLDAPPQPSPFWLRRRLLAVGQRPLNDVVDLTNYVLHEIGQPTHAFDRDRLAGGRIRVRSAGEGERFRTLDGVERLLRPADLVIADGERAVALAGIMGGEETEVGEATTRILLESASFHPARIRRTSQRLALRTEASARFEKALDPTLAWDALARFRFHLQRLRPEARFPGPPGRAGELRPPRRVLELDPVRTARLLGMGWSEEDAPERVRRPLEALGFAVRPGPGGCFEVEVPSWRATRDVTRPVDLVEEVGRLAGYHRIQPAPLVAPVERPRPDPLRALDRILADRAALAHGGHQTEAYSFLEDAWAARLGLEEADFVRLANPVQEGVRLVRRDPVPSLLEQACANARERAQGLLFEVAEGYEPAAAGEPRERHWFGAVLWAPPAAEADGPASLFGRARTLAQDLLRAARAEARPQPPSEAGEAPAWVHPAARLEWEGPGGAWLGRAGLLHPLLRRELDLEDREVALVLLDRAALLAAKDEGAVSFRPIRRYPAVKVDVALALPASVSCAEVEEALRRAAGKLLDGLEFFDRYAGPGLPEGWRSLAFHVRLRAADRTLAEKDEQRFLQRAARAAEELGGQLRTA